MLTEFKNYFENLAVQHVGINHTSNNAKQQGFFYCSIEAILGEMRIGIPSPQGAPTTILYALLPNFGYDANEPINMEMTGGFMVCTMAPDQSPNAILAAKEKSLIISNEIIMRIRHDVYTEAPNPFGVDLDLTQCAGLDAGLIHSNYYGYIVTFPYKFFIGHCVDGNRWDDLPDEHIYYDE